MMVEHGKLDFLYRPFVSRRRARVIDDPIARAIRTLYAQARRAQKYHHVKRVLLDPRLIEEKQIARFGFTPIAADKDAVEIFQ